MLNTLIAVTGAVVAAQSLPHNAPSWAPALAVMPACVPARRHTTWGRAVSAVCALAAAGLPLLLVTPGPWQQCSDTEFIGVVILSAGLALRAVGCVSPTGALAVRAALPTGSEFSFADLF